MVKLLHAAGLEVVLDVVYNHTCEQSATGGTLSWRGLDGRAYYRLDERGNDIDVTGCGNTLDLRHPVVGPDGAGLAALLGAGVHVDGFRFDLARRAGARAATTTTTPTTRSSWPCAPTRCSRGSRTSPSRGTSASTGGAPASSPRRSASGTTASATACGPSGWPAWAATASAAGPRGAGPRHPARRLAGPLRHAATAGRSPRSTSSPRTTASPLATSRRTTSSTTTPTARATATAATTTSPGTTASRGRPTTRRSCRRAAARCATCSARSLTSTGVPMLNAGDEFGRTQDGNNNPYCQDNEISWFDWDLAPWQHDLSRPRATSSACGRRPRCCASGPSPPGGRSATTGRPTSRGTPPTAAA